MSKFTSDQAREIATQVSAAYRIAATQIEAIAQSVTDPDAALWEIHRVILGELVSAPFELAQDALYPALSSAAE